MTITMGKITLTTEHPASSYGMPVALIEGQAYGPADDVIVGGVETGCAAGKVWSAAGWHGQWRHPLVQQFCALRFEVGTEIP